MAPRLPKQEQIFRLACVILSIPIFMAGVSAFNIGRSSAGIFYVSATFGLLALSNLKGTAEKMSLDELRRARWSFTIVGMLFNALYWLGMAIWVWSLLRFS